MRYDRELCRRVEAYRREHPKASAGWIAAALQASGPAVVHAIAELQGRAAPIAKRASRREAAELEERLIKLMRDREEVHMNDVAEALGITPNRAKHALRYLEIDGRAKSDVVPYHKLANPPAKGGRERRYYRLVASGERAA